MGISSLSSSIFLIVWTTTSLCRNGPLADAAYYPSNGNKQHIPPSYSQAGAARRQAASSTAGDSYYSWSDLYGSSQASATFSRRFVVGRNNHYRRALHHEGRIHHAGSFSSASASLLSSTTTDSASPINSTTTTESQSTSTTTSQEIPSPSSSSSSSSASSSSLSSAAPGEKLRLLKDLMWVREAQEDLTAAEFACTVEANNERALQGEAEDAQRKRKRAVDYEKLLSRLNQRIRDLGCEAQGDGTVACVLSAGVGAGSIVYDEDQRKTLLERILVTRQVLLEFMKGNELYHDEDMSFSISLPEIRVEIPKEDDHSSPGPKLYVRDDGTVDWDGALQDRDALRLFGTAVWARINGRDPDYVEGQDSIFSHKPKEVTARIEETPRIREERMKLDKLQAELQEMEKKHIALLNSAISAGQAVANVNLASLAPAQRVKIRNSAEELEKRQENVAFQTLIYELERIFTYLMGEVGNPSSTGYIPLQDRLNVAEFGLLESQLNALSRMITDSETLDSDVLAVVTEQVNDMKRRLGIDYLVTGLSFDQEAIRIWLGDLLVKTKKGLAFYVKGVRLFWNDVVFCLSLINRAAQGYTLKPREVRTIRRTFKDVITFIPVVIILLIPLSPVGHVLVFGAIQRFFPDFFPSCFTEQRQNLLQLYETTEYTEFTIKENWKEKISRLTEAILYVVANASRAIYLKLAELARSPSSPNGGPDENQ